VEHEEQSERMERDAERLEHDSEKLGEHIEETQREWESKQQDPSVPGARPEPGEEKEEEAVPGVAADEETLSEEGGP
jgi:hypothetical protein